MDHKIYSNRTLNMRSLKAIGYDMDYTLIDYKVEEWESRAYEHIKDKLISNGWPVSKLEFDPMMISRGLIIDTENGNIVKANRFGFIKSARHGTKNIGFEKQRDVYSRTIVDLSDRRWIFLNTLFSLSEGCMYAQLVDLLDEKAIEAPIGYVELYGIVRNILDNAHMEGKLKAEIVSDPARFVCLDPEIPLTLLDQKHSGKKILLITNSDWDYTNSMMKYACDPFMPNGQKWQDLFDIVIVGARKPHFFNTDSPFFEIIPETGLLRPTPLTIKENSAYWGGSARQLEKHLGLSGDEILYVGDHMFGDVHVTKNILRWRTALILRELEEELKATASFHKTTLDIQELMKRKELLEQQLFKLRLNVQRTKYKYHRAQTNIQDEEKQISSIRTQLTELDQKLSPLAKASAELSNPRWGLLLRSGNDKSYLAYQLERYADVYTSKVSNFLHATPFAYLRSPRGNLPHDQE